jgi:hypothetical protein
MSYDVTRPDGQTFKFLFFSTLPNGFILKISKL